MADLSNHHQTPSLSHDIDSDPEIAAIRDGREGYIPTKSGGISTTSSNSTASSNSIPGTFHDIDSDDELAAMKAGGLPIEAGGISMDAFVPPYPHMETHGIDSGGKFLAMRDTGLMSTGARTSYGARRTGGPSARYKQKADIDSDDELAAKKQEGKGGTPIKSNNDAASTSTSAKSAKSAKSTGPKELKAKRKPPNTPEVASSSARQDNTEGLRGRQRRLGSDEQAQPMVHQGLREGPADETNDGILGDPWTVPVPVAIGLMMCTPFMMMILALWWNNSSKKG